MVLLNVPLHQNQGPLCAEFSLEGILEFLGRPFTIDEIRRGINRNEGKIIFPVELIPFIHRLELPFCYSIDRNEFEETLGGRLEEKMKSYYGPEKAKRLLQTMNLPNFLLALNYVCGNNLGTDQEVTIEMLEQAINERRIPLILVNFNLLQGQPDDTKGHYVYLTGVDNRNFYYDDTGPVTIGKYKPIRKERLSELLKLTWHDSSTVVLG